MRATATFYGHLIGLASTTIGSHTALRLEAIQGQLQSSSAKPRGVWELASAQHAFVSSHLYMASSIRSLAYSVHAKASKLHSTYTSQNTCCVALSTPHSAHVPRVLLEVKHHTAELRIECIYYRIEFTKLLM